MSQFKHGLGPFFGGILFSLGLGISGMTEPSKIIAFLDIFGDWDATLIFVMAGAVGVNGILHRFITKKPFPLFDSKFYLPTRMDVDRRLIVGSAIFGVGWGVTGLCPGPGIASLSSGNLYAFSFVGSMLFGMWVITLVSGSKS